MSFPDIQFCPGTLAEGFSSYSPSCLRNLFDGKKVSHILPFDSPSKNEDDAALFIENRQRISISGVQEKVSLRLEKNKLRLTKPGEFGTYILKPIPRDLKKVDQVPANEHLTMQIARQVYGINTAENALIFFKDGTPAYITKRFDVNADGSKRSKEDFAALSGRTSDNAGDNFKYNSSYEEIGLLLQKYSPAAWRIEIEKYFVLVVFNYLFSNGDAHLKNFSLVEIASGDHILSPAYDLLNTHLHISDSDFALAKGLFADNFKSKKYRSSLHPTQVDFIEFAKRISVLERRIEKLLTPFLEKQAKVESLLERSYLNTTSKRSYLENYRQRRNYLLA